MKQAILSIVFATLLAIGYAAVVKTILSDVSSAVTMVVK